MSEDDFAYDALVEGDAVRVQDDYQASLPKKVQAALNKSDNAQYAQYAKQVKGVPGFLITDSETPYVLGPQTVTEIYKRGGNAAVNALFKNPPIHEIQLMEPWLVGQKWTPHSFSKPVLAKGDKSLGRGEFGAYYLYLLLTQKLSINQALAAADSWGGDQELSYTHNGQACMAISFTGSTSQGTQRI